MRRKSESEVFFGSLVTATNVGGDPHSLLAADNLRLHFASLDLREQFGHQDPEVPGYETTAGQSFPNKTFFNRR